MSYDLGIFVVVVVCFALKFKEFDLEVMIFLGSIYF